MATSAMHSQLPKLDDDEVGTEKEHIVPRDDERDLKFRGTLLASVAPASAWQARAIRFFGYDVLAKQPYRKLDLEAAEKID